MVRNSRHYFNYNRLNRLNSNKPMRNHTANRKVSKRIIAAPRVFENIEEVVHYFYPDEILDFIDKMCNKYYNPQLIADYIIDNKFYEDFCHEGATANGYFFECEVFEMWNEWAVAAIVDKYGDDIICDIEKMLGIEIKNGQHQEIKFYMGLTYKSGDSSEMFHNVTYDDTYIIYKLVEDKVYDSLFKYSLDIVEYFADKGYHDKGDY